MHRPLLTFTTRPRTPRFSTVSLLAALVALSSTPAMAAGLLGTAQDFTILGNQTVTNAHSPPNATTQVFGEVGVTPGTAITGFSPTGTLTGGALHSNDLTAQNAMTDATAAYANLDARTGATDLTGGVLGLLGYSLTPGVYSFDSTALLVGTQVLDFSSDPDGSFVFQIGSALTTASDSLISVIGAGANSSIYWQVGSAATFGSQTEFAGNVLALTSVSFAPRASLEGGRAFALGGAVTLIDNLATNNCSTGALGSGCNDAGSFGYSGQASAIPEPASLVLMLSGLAVVVTRRKAPST